MAFVFTVRLMGPVIRMLTPFAGLEPSTTRIVTVCALPLARSSFGPTASVRQSSGAGLGFAVGGVSGAGTIVSASSVLSAGLVRAAAADDGGRVDVAPDRGRAGGDPDRHRLARRIEPRLQVTSAGVTEQVPCDGFAVRYEMPLGAGSATWTLVAVSGPLFVTVRS